MRLVCLTAFLILSIGQTTTATAESTPVAVKRFFTENYPNFDIDGAPLAEGDIDGDGLADIALVAYTKLRNEGHTAKLFVLRRTSDGDFSLLATSLNSIAPQHGADLSIRKQSLFIYKFHGSEVSNNFFQSQFKYRGGRIVLIGSEETHEATSGVLPAASYMDQHTSTNYLTRIVIDTYKRNGRVVKTVKSKLPAQPLTVIEDYQL